MLRYFYDSVKLRTEELAELAENSREDGDPNDAFSQSRRTFGIVLCTHRFPLSTFLTVLASRQID